MTRGARSARAALLTALAVGWAVAGHLLGSGSSGAHSVEAMGAPVAAEVAGAGGAAAHHLSGGGLLLPVLWSTLVVALLAWGLLPGVRRAPRGAGAARVGLVLGAGQLITHVALSVAPLLAGQRLSPGAGHAAGAPAGHVHGTGHLLGTGQVPATGPLLGTGNVQTADRLTGAPQLADLLAAVAHGGTTMLLTHLGATLAAATGVALLGALGRAVLLWWGRLTPRPARLVGVLRASTTVPLPTRPARRPVRSWDRRGPPVLGSCTA